MNAFGTADEAREAISALDLPSPGDTIAVLGALEEAGIIGRIAAAPKSRHRSLIRAAAEALRLDDDATKDLGHAVREACRERATKAGGDGGDGGDDDDADSIAQMLIAFGRRDRLFHDGTGRAYACVDHGSSGGFETVPIGSERHEEILALRLWKDSAVPSSTTSMHDASRTLRAIAKADGDRRDVHLRYARIGKTIYYDLADERRRAVAVTREGWKIVNRPPVMFVRFKNTLGQVEPKRGGSLDELRNFVNVEDEHWPLVVGWLVQALIPDIPRYAMVLAGRQGSAKTTTARLLRKLVDPAEADMVPLPKKTDQFAIVASKNALLAADNVSGIPRDMSDALCACITGHGYSRRTLYRDDDESIWRYQRTVLLTGIGSIIWYPDLLDRSLLVRCPQIRPTDRRRERALWQAFEAAIPRILGALFDTLAASLRLLEEVELPAGTRMADAGQAMLAASRRLGIEEELQSALRGNTEEQVREALEESLIARPLLAVLERQGGYGGENGGSTAGLLGLLNEEAGEALRRERGWPRSPRKLRSALDAIEPALEHLGWSVVRGRTPGSRGRDRVLWIEQAVPAASNPGKSPSAAPGGGRPTDRPHRPHRPSSVGGDEGDDGDGPPRHCQVPRNHETTPGAGVGRREPSPTQPGCGPDAPYNGAGLETLPEPGDGAPPRGASGGPHATACGGQRGTPCCRSGCPYCGPLIAAGRLEDAS